MGEKLRWYELAARQHKTVQEMQQQTTSSEFVDWCVFYDSLWVNFNELYHYLAQLTYYVVAPNTNESWQGQIADFLFRFESKKSTSTEESRKEQAEKSKAIWIGSLTATWENRDHISSKGRE